MWNLSQGLCPGSSIWSQIDDLGRGHLVKDLHPVWHLPGLFTYYLYPIFTSELQDKSPWRDEETEGQSGS